MSRLPLLIATAALAIGVSSAADAQIPGPHIESGVLDRVCGACHRGHGVSQTPMLRRSSDALCLGCHASGVLSGADKLELGMDPAADPQDLTSILARPFTHNRTRCVDCHSVHGVPALPDPPEEVLQLGGVRPSTRRGFVSEADLCLSCHGSRGARQGDPQDLSLLFDLTNPSYHPVLGQGRGTDVPSLIPPLSTSSLISCGDCHRGDEPGGPRGPHGSLNPGLLAARYDANLEQPESAEAYALCYACHDRETVLENDPFPEHSTHVQDSGIPCSRCHDAHGATEGRALIRFNEPRAITGVAPSSSGRLEFISDGPGGGLCYLSCHGEDHDPEGYGDMAFEKGLTPRPFGRSLAAPVKRPESGTQSH